MSLHSARSAAASLIALILLAFPSLPAVALDCRDGGATQTDMNICAAKNLASSDAKLNADYQKILSCLKPAGGQETPLVEAQKAWLRFRDLECRFQGSASAGGSVQPMVVAQCLKALTDDRVKQLNYYLTCREGDASCPTWSCRAGK